MNRQIWQTGFLQDELSELADRFTRWTVRSGRQIYQLNLQIWQTDFPDEPSDLADRFPRWTVRSGRQIYQINQSDLVYRFTRWISQIWYTDLPDEPSDLAYRFIRWTVRSGRQIFAMNCEIWQTDFLDKPSDLADRLTRWTVRSGRQLPELRFTRIPPTPPPFSAISMLVFKRLLVHHLDKGDTARPQLNPRLSWAFYPGTAENWDLSMVKFCPLRPRTVRRTSHGNATSNMKIPAIIRYLKETVPRDFRLKVFFKNQFPQSPWVSH